MDFREEAYGEKLKDRLGWTLQAPERWRLSDMLLSAAVGIVVAAIVLLAGCATDLPPCERYNYRIAEDNEGATFVLIDMENVVKLSAMLEGVSSGKCRITKDGEV